jgi:hypothetical protein
MAQSAAVKDTVPSLGAGFPVGTFDGKIAWSGMWSSAYSPLEVDYSNMYDDGWAGRGATENYNYACTSAKAAQCWGSRNAILGEYVGVRCNDCELGVGYNPRGSQGIYTDLIVKPAGTAPAMTFTWAKNVVPFLSAK